MDSKKAATYEKDDPTFVQDLKDSEPAVWLVAHWLHSQGQHVTMRALRIRPAAEEMDQFSDTGDLELIQRLEVKARTFDFTCAGDFPYPTVIVDTPYTYERATPKPYAYFILNKAHTHCCIVKGRTKKYWTQTQRWDHKKQRERTFYECPIQHATFCEVPTNKTP